MLLSTSRNTIFLVLTALAVCNNILSINAIPGRSVKKSCAKLFKEEGLGDEKSDSFVLKDGTRVSNFEEEYVTIDSVWNLTKSIQIEEGCTLTACNASYFDGTCLDLKGSMEKLPQDLDVLLSASCSCENDCKCSDIKLRMTSCARAYLKGGCNTCSPYYTDLKGSKPEFPDQFAGQIEAIKVRTGCSLSVYDEAFYEGEFQVITDTVENWNGSLASYECTCSPESFKPREKPPRPDDYPVLLDMPSTIDNVSALMVGDLERHPGLMAAKLSLKSGRSSKNAYILLLGTTGSGKSSAINLLFDNPNITLVGGVKSTTSDIHEFRISVPVDELGIQNSELRVIDTPGLGDTRGLDQDSKFLATLDDYLSTHEELHDTTPNVVLIFHKFNDNRFEGDASFFVKMLRGLDSFRNKVTDDSYSNVIFVLSHFCSVTKEMSRRPAKRLQQFKTVIEDYSQFPKPIVIAVAENKGDEEDLPMVNGYYKLPNGDYYPKNLFDKIQILTEGGNDPIGDAVIRTAFKDSDGFKVNSSTYRLVESANTKVTKYLGILSNAVFSPTDTQISQMLAKAYETMDSKLKSKFPGVLNYLQKALNIRDILTEENIPRTTLGILELLSSLKKNEATIYLLANGLGIKPPIYEENVVTGYSYNVFNDAQLPKSPYKLGEMINSDIGYLFPSAVSCTVENQNIDIYQTIPDKEAYLKVLLSNLGIEGSISVDEFKGKTKPGYNIVNEQYLNNSCAMTAMREIRTFQLNLNENPKLTQEFIDAVKLLPVLNQSDFENVQTWKSFFNEYGTHVVKSIHGGGSIEVRLNSDKPCGPEIAGALFKVIQFAEDLTVLNDNSTGTLGSEGVLPVLKFKGGDQKFHTSDLTKMSLGAASKLLREWKKSLRLKPAILTTEMKLYPISSVVKSIGQNVSAEIQRATTILFNSTLKVVFTRKNDDVPTDRDGIAKANENQAIMTLIETLMLDMKESRIRNEQAQARFHEQLQLAEERRHKAAEEFRIYEMEMRANATREDRAQREKYETERNAMMEKHLTYQRDAEKKQREMEDARRRSEQRAEEIRRQREKELQDEIEAASRPKPGGCLRSTTPILMATGDYKDVADLKAGDVLLDVDLNPTTVLGVSQEFKRHSSFYGYSNQSYFFTNTHLFLGPQLPKLVRQSLDMTQLFTKDLGSLTEENPLLEYLNVKDMDDEESFLLYRYNPMTKSVDTEMVRVLDEPPKEYSEEEIVYFIQVDSPTGTYFANGFVCRHEIPPIEHWPNTMGVIFSVFSNPNLPPLYKIPYSLESVIIIENIVKKVRSNILDTLRALKISEMGTDVAPLEVDNKVVQEVLANVYNEPIFSAFGVGIYGKVGKVMAMYLDTEETKINSEKIGNLQKILVDALSKEINKAFTVYFS